MNLSPTMQRALDLARRHDGRLYRFPGGFWSHKDWGLDKDDEGHFGTQTINALIDRGAVEVTEFAGAVGYDYPCEVKVV